MTINIKNSDQVITPEEFQVLIVNHDVGFLSSPDYADLLSETSIEYVLRNKDCGFVSALMSIMDEIPAEKQENYLSKVDSRSWNFIFSFQSALDYSIHQINEVCRLAPTHIQQKVLTEELKSNHLGSGIAYYIQELTTTPTGRRVLKNVGKDFSGEEWMKWIPNPMCFIPHKDNPAVDTNIIQSMCNICDGFQKFTEADWLHLASFYDAPVLIGAMTTECTANRGWDKITPESLIDWCQQRSTDYRKDTVAIMISEWAANRSIAGKIDRHKNLSSLFLVSLHTGSSDNIKTLIAGQMDKAPVVNPDELKLTKDQWHALEPLTKKQWMELVLKDPNMPPIALEIEFGHKIPLQSLNTFWARFKHGFLDTFRLPRASELQRELTEKYTFLKQSYNAISKSTSTPKIADNGELHKSTDSKEQIPQTKETTSINPDQLISQIKEIRRVESISLPTPDMAKARSRSHSHHQ